MDLTAVIITIRRIWNHDVRAQLLEAIKVLHRLSIDVDIHLLTVVTKLLASVRSQYAVAVIFIA